MAECEFSDFSCTTVNVFENVVLHAIIHCEGELHQCLEALVDHRMAPLQVGK